MRGRRALAAVSALAIAALAGCSTNDPTGDTGALATPTSTGQAAPVELVQAKLRVEINATDGDAGLQVDLDHEPWSQVQLLGPDGRVLTDVRNAGVLADYGLTELFAESSEPPFTEFPLEEFQALFPEGEYTFEGEQTDGVPMRSTFVLTHDFPAGPVVTSPDDDAVVAPDGLVVGWEPGDDPVGVRIVGYQVLVESEDDPVRTLALDLPAEARSVAVPAEFLAEPGEYKVEVLAIEQSGNQTLTEVPFRVE